MMTPHAWLPVEALRELVTNAGLSEPIETGGILIGYWTANREHVVVTHVVGPGASAIHRPRSFEPDPDFHQAETARLYTESGRRYGYLGDWHSHPRGGCRPSTRDKRTLRRIARSDSARAQQPLMGILFSPRESEWALALWMWAARPFLGVDFGVPSLLAVSIFEAVRE